MVLYLSKQECNQLILLTKSLIRVILLLQTILLEDTMVKHMIIWKLKDEIEDKENCAQEIKIALEGLVGKIDGLLGMKILTEKFESSAGDIMMDSTFIDNEALKNYQKSPLHQEIANGLVGPSVQSRLSFDYEI